MPPTVPWRIACIDQPAYESSVDAYPTGARFADAASDTASTCNPLNGSQFLGWPSWRRPLSGSKAISLDPVAAQTRRPSWVTPNQRRSLTKDEAIQAALAKYRKAPGGLLPIVPKEL
jgi:hypothetical protein